MYPKDLSLLDNVVLDILYLLAICVKLGLSVLDKYSSIASFKALTYEAFAPLYI